MIKSFSPWAPALLGWAALRLMGGVGFAALLVPLDSGESAANPATQQGGGPEPALAIRWAESDGVARVDGLVFLIRDGHPHRVDYDMSPPEAPRVRTDGFVHLKSGLRLTLQDGQMVTFDGRLIGAPASISTTSPNQR